MDRTSRDGSGVCFRGRALGSLRSFCLSVICGMCCLIQTTVAQQAETAVDDKAADSAVLVSINRQAEAQAQQELQSNPAPEQDDPGRVAVWSRRGDALMYLGRFREAEEAYRQMVVADPDLDASHWRLGIACYFSGNYAAGAEQFDKYHSFDNVDRENGIWRYFCHYRASGAEAARRQLLRYEKDDRPPFREVYSLFEGRLTGADVTAAAEQGGESSREQRLFYSWLYVGLNAALQGQRKDAIESLQLATESKWPLRAGYGPNYMWHVGRLELNRQLQLQEQTPPQ